MVFGCRFVNSTSYINRVSLFQGGCITVNFMGPWRRSRFVMSPYGLAGAQTGDMKDFVLRALPAELYLFIILCLL